MIAKLYSIPTIVLALLAFPTLKYYLHKDEEIHQEKTNSLFQEKENQEDVKKDVECPPDKLDLQLKKNFTKPNTKDGPFFKSAFTSLSGSIPLDTVFISLLIHTCGADLVASIYTVYNNITLASVIVELAALAVFAVCKWKQKGVQRELEEKNVQLQKELEEKIVQLQKELEEKREEREDMVQVVNTLMEQKRDLENQKDQLKDFLENTETQREENKQKLQSVEKEITEKEMTFDKPEELLREKENLLREQWKLDQIKKDNEKQLLNIERLLEPIEMQVTRIQERRK